MKNPVFDKDLTALLRNCENSDLDPIVETILSIPSQTLTRQKSFREHRGDHKAYVDEIIYEITSLGGNTLANLVRGHGVAYREMVCDVAAKLGIHAGASDDVETVEEKVILKLLHMAYRKMSAEDRSALAELINAGFPEGESIDFDDNFPELEISRRLGDGATSLLGDRLQHAIDIASHSTRVRRGLVGATKLVLTRMATGALGGPISWAATLGEGLYNLLGPNYPASVALVAHIGLIRQKYEQIDRDMVTEMVAEGELA